MDLVNDDVNFIRLFRELKRSKNLTQYKANDIITKYYPDLNFFPEKAGKIYINQLVFWKMKNIDDKIKTLKIAFNLINSVYPKLYKNPNTLDNTYTQYIRQPMLKRFPSPTGKKGDDSIQYALSKKLVALPVDIKGKILKDAKDKGTQKLKNQVVINMEEILNIITTNIESDDPMRRALALLMCCGSRTIEFFGKSTYSKYDFENTNNWVIQNFIAKKRGNSIKTESNIKPIIHFTNDEFIKLRDQTIEELYKQYDTTSFLEIKNDKEKLIGKIVSKGNIVAKKMFNNKEGFTMHTCRSLYALLSYDLYGHKDSPHGSKVEFRQWISDVLGKEGDESATREYARFILSKSNTNEL